jgi:hypothetical protein
LGYDGVWSRKGLKEEERKRREDNFPPSAQSDGKIEGHNHTLQYREGRLDVVLKAKGRARALNTRASQGKLKQALILILFSLQGCHRFH